MPARALRLIATPWGEATPLYWIYGLYKVCEVCEPDGAPENQVPSRGYAVVDALTGIATVFADGDADSDGSEPVHSAHLRLEGKTGETVLREIRVELARAGIPVYPDRLYVKMDAFSFPWEWEDVRFRVPYVANDEVSAPLVGYAVDPDTQEVVYLHIAGHKTALRSIWGTLSNSGGASVSINGARHHFFAFSSHNYATYSDPIDPETNLYRMIIVDKRAVEQMVEDHAYLLVPRDSKDLDLGLDLGRVLAARLNALLPIPVLPEWGKTLYRYGIRNDGLLTPCLLSLIHI